MKALLLLCLTGCLQIEAEIEESCVTRSGVEVEGVELSSLSQTFMIDDLSEVHRFTDNADADIQFVRATIRPTSGVTSLAFVEAASVVIEGETVYACAGDCPSGEGVELPSQTRTDAMKYLSADALAFTLSVDGELPKTAWTVDVDVCVRGNVSYSSAR
ncbi:MAG TPA: hypothetical protein VK427_25065 [Kofleriaceae bacterium]|nr:hypothetical protein [Kofleriaceae bacterium]